MRATEDSCNITTRVQVTFSRKYYSGDQIEEYVMGHAHGPHEGK